jgi:Asparagine synthase
VTAATSLYVMSPMEVVFGYVFGHEGMIAPSSDAGRTPREALERVVRDALLRPPCGVAFSGGRDSSLVLAVATHVARRDGLTEPVPITTVYPGVDDADESTWQELVVRHLKLRDWQRVTIRDELDVIGPLAASHLLTDGLLWPPTIAVDVPFIEAVPGGSILDGEGGDEVLGTRAHRIAPVTRLLRSPRPLTWSRVRSALVAIAPRPLRTAHSRHRRTVSRLTWLRPMALDALGDVIDQRERQSPLTFAASVRMVPTRRTQVLMARNRRILAERRDVAMSSPLLHPDFVHALARDGGVLGRGTRTDVLRSLAPDLLPDQVLARTTKAAFTLCYLSRYTREFAAQWTGAGVDHELVDPDDLRRAWLSDRPPAPTAALLQSAWVASSKPVSADARPGLRIERIGD